MHTLLENSPRSDCPTLVTFDIGVLIEPPSIEKDVSNFKPTQLYQTKNNFTKKSSSCGNKLSMPSLELQYFDRVAESE
jgi:hypothetical protein